MSGIVQIFPTDPQHHVDNAATNTAVNAKDTSGHFLGGDAWNPAGTIAYLQVFSADAGDVVLGTTVPDYTHAIAPTAVTLFQPARPIPLGSAISYAVTATRDGAGAPGSAVSLGVDYR